MAARTAQIATETGNAEAALTIGQIVDSPFPVSVLPAAGWRVVRRFNRMARGLSDADAGDVPLPGGVTVGKVITEDDRRSYHRIHDETFSEHWVSVAEPYQTWTERVATWQSIDWSLWWLASLDGVDVACLKCSQWTPGVGFVDTVGVLKSARGRGLGSALVRVGFAELARRGCTRVELRVDTDNGTGALRVYEAAGLTPAFQADIWELRVAAG